jgi:hemoglobin
MEQKNNSLFEQVGGEEAVRQLVVKLYTKILQDELLAPFFETISVEKLRSSQRAFITMALGGPNNYTGKALRHAHKPLVDRGLNDQHFDAVKLHINVSMQELGVAKPLIEQTMDIVETTRHDILCRSVTETTG